MTQETPLVSILIPTYNRAHLIGETLDSVLMQTYQNWECIVVDDGSTDKTVKLMTEYIAKDSRFQYFNRPNTKPKGANACRNMGLDKAKGGYIIFFDSDDVMSNDHIQVKLNPLLKGHFNFSIARTEWMKIDKKSLAHVYSFDKYKVTAHNYISQNINWLTLDICINAEIAKAIRFNEKLQSGQEYNYFAKLLLITTNGYIINQVVSLRRRHKESVQSKLRSSGEKRNSSFISKWQTYLEISKLLTKNTKKVLLSKIIKTMLINGNMRIAEKTFFIKELYKVYGMKANLFFPLLLMKKIFNRGYNMQDYFNSNR